MREKLVFDFRNQYDSEELIMMGFTYYCVGRPDSHRTLNGLDISNPKAFAGEVPFGSARVETSL